MERIASKLVDAFIELKIIENDKKNNYQYGVEFLFMKVIGIIIVGMIGFLTHKILETITFYITFNSLRKYTNGYHSKKLILCIIESILTYSLICMVLSKFLANYVFQLHFITFISLFIIYVLSPINSDSIMLDEKEIRKHRENIKYILLIDFVILTIAVNFQIKLSFVIFFDLAILLDLLLILLEIVIAKYKEGSN